MKKILFLALVVSLAFFLGMTANPVMAGSKVIKIGVIYPLTGGAAAAGRELRAGAELAAEIANNAMALMSNELATKIAELNGTPNMPSRTVNNGTKINPRIMPNNDFSNLFNETPFNKANEVSTPGTNIIIAVITAARIEANKLIHLLILDYNI